MDRKESIKKILSDSPSPISASKLASELGVSRQIIVGDIALLRASGFDILATPRGYIVNSKSSEKNKHSIVCQHDNSKLLDELYTIIDLGGCVLDVTVEHSVYGQISAPLRLSSRFDVDSFMKSLQSADAKPLSELTDGLHLHCITCPSDECFERICDALRQKGILYEA